MTTLLNEFETLNKSQTREQRADYKAIIQRSHAPEEGDAYILGSLAKSLGITAEDVAADIRAWNELQKLEAEKLPAGEIDRLQQANEATREVCEQHLRELINRLIARLEVTSLPALVQLVQSHLVSVASLNAGGGYRPVDTGDEELRAINIRLIEADHALKLARSRESSTARSIAELKAAHPRISG